MTPQPLTAVIYLTTVGMRHDSTLAVGLLRPLSGKCLNVGISSSYHSYGQNAVLCSPITRDPEPLYSTKSRLRTTSTYLSPHTQGPGALPGLSNHVHKH